MEQTADNNDLVFIFQNHRLILEDHHIPTYGSLSKIISLPQNLYFLCKYRSQNCLIASWPVDTNLAPGFEAFPVRRGKTLFTDEIVRLIGFAAHIHFWLEHHHFCGRCGREMSNKSSERARVCNHCQEEVFPRISPCIIVLITRGPDLLLARSPHFSPGMYSTLAGFIEPGESVEEAVYREVQEEVGIHIKNLRYAGSQPWPFPDSLMLGFRADYSSGDIAIDGFEIEDAQWFSPDNLPLLPSTASIARELIEQHLQSLS